MKSICIIPARGGSKRIKNKNIIKFNKQPMIYWSVKAAKKSKCFDRIVISTDCEKIIKVAKQLKVDFIKRPSKLALDSTPLLAVIRHYIKNMEEKYSTICCLLPSSPLIFYKDIVNSKKLLKKNTSFVFPITNYSYPIDKSLVKNKKNYVSLKNNSTALINTQKLKEYYHDAGQFYWGFTSDFLKFKNIFSSKKVKGYFLPNYRVKDIDNYSDLKVAINIFKSFF